MPAATPTPPGARPAAAASPSPDARRGSPPAPRDTTGTPPRAPRPRAPGLSSARRRRTRGADPPHVPPPGSSHCRPSVLREIAIHAELGQLPPESLQCVTHAALHRVFRNAGHFRDLAERNTAVLAEEKHFPLLGRKGAKRGFDQRLEAAVVRAALGTHALLIRHLLAQRAGVSVLRVDRRIQRLGPAVAFLARAVHAEVPRDGVHPRREPGSRLVVLSAAHHLEPGLLQHILRPRRVPREPEDEVVDRRPMAKHELLERARVSAAERE